jgi:hypothetical protein
MSSSAWKRRLIGRPGGDLAETLDWATRLPKLTTTGKYLWQSDIFVSNVGSSYLSWLLFRNKQEQAVSNRMRLLYEVAYWKWHRGARWCRLKRWVASQRATDRCAADLCRLWEANCRQMTSWNRPVYKLGFSANLHAKRAAMGCHWKLNAT